MILIIIHSECPIKTDGVKDKARVEVVNLLRYNQVRTRSAKDD